LVYVSRSAERKNMKITIEVTQEDLAEMGVSTEQLEDAVKQEIHGGLEVDGDTLYVNDADVSVVVAD
jgi:multidrug efflux pump subunit AcrB